MAQASSPGTGSEPGVRSRRHGAALEEALLHAAWEELIDVGYARLSMEGVAVRAGTGKAVLYRRWPNRAALVRAVVRWRVGSVSSDVPDSGDLREDILQVLRRMRDSYKEIGPDIAHGLMTELADVPREAFEVIPVVMSALLDRAAERGEVRLKQVTARIVALPGDLLRHELMVSGAPSDDFLAEVVDEVFLPLTVAGRR